MADLLTLADAKTFLDVSGTAEDVLLTALLDEAEALFENQCGREDHPFKASAAGVTEVHDGTGGCHLDLLYPINTVTTIKLGRDVATPDETLDPTDLDDVVWGAGERRISRTDAGIFGTNGLRRYVHVTYDHQDDLPIVGRMAIKRALAGVYRQRGSEDARSEREGGFSHVLAEVVAGDPVWKMAVEQVWDPRF